MQLTRPPNWQVFAILTLGVLATSTAAVLVRLAMASAGASGVGFSLVIAAFRLNLAAIALLPNWQRIHHSKPAPVALRYAAFAGIALALHFATWITSLSYTSIAASTTLVTTNPVWVALLLWLWFGEKPARLTLVGILVALAGGFVMGLGETSTHSGSNPLLGNGLALLGAWAASLYFLLGREAQRNGLSISSYATVTYSVAAIVLLPLPFLFQTSYTGYSRLTYAYLALMALLPQLIGHTSLNWSVRWISPTIVTLAILFEPVASSLMAYLLFYEQPGQTLLIGAAILLMGVAISTLSSTVPVEKASRRNER